MTASRISAGIDLRAINLTQSGGIAPMIKHLIERLCKAKPDWDIHIFATIFSHDLIDGTVANNLHHHSLPLHNFYPILATECRYLGIDIMFRAFPGDIQPDFPDDRLITLIPDMQHVALPDLFSADDLVFRDAAFAAASQQNKTILTISHAARRDILSRYPDADVRMMYPADAHAGQKPENSTITTDKLPPHFFFYPANLWPHKNHAVLIDAFNRFQQRHPNGQSWKLVLTGDPDGWGTFANNVVGDQILHLGFVSRGTLQTLYHHAAALVFPSLFEGFGMPVIEAFRAGCPVICSDRGSLPEIGGDACLICDPDNPDSIALQMMHIADGDIDRDALIAKGKTRAKQFTWENSAATFARIMEDVARHAAPKPITDHPKTPHGFRHSRLYTGIAACWRKASFWGYRSLSGWHTGFANTPSASPTGQTGVSGVFLDNWMSDRVYLPVRHNIESPGYIRGQADIHTSLVIHAGNKLVATHHLKARQTTTITLPNCPEPLSLTFTRALEDSAGRRLAFRLEATNYFSEHQLLSRP